MDTLQAKYLKDIRPKLMDEFKINNVFDVPKLSKIVINIGLAEAKDNAGILDNAKNVLMSLSGQIPVVTKAKKSIAAFKLTKGAPIGLMVTLRRKKMYAFMDKLVNIVLPKVRDFRGVSEASFDARGNFNLGFREQAIFPEVNFKDVDKLRGLQVTINTTAQDKERGKRLLELLGMPFKKGDR